MVGATEAALSVIVPVWNEAEVLPRSVPAVLAAVGGMPVRLVYVCNGCSDGSADLARRLLGGRGAVIELARPGKPGALNVGDVAAGDVFPRFYLDADVLPAPDAFHILAAALNAGQADLVAPEIRFDTQDMGLPARWVAEVWLALPHASVAFHHLLGVSRAGRARWGDFPDVIADDVFIEAAVPPPRRAVLAATHVVTRPPSRLSGWIATRRRWAAGEAGLRAMGIAVPRAGGQRKALLRMVLTPRWSGKALLYLAVRLAARLPVRRPPRWARQR